ncbi:MAG TPA: PIN domain-containing protein [Anaerolineae bacterium]|jgi:predicted nucleic acid-binding protein|nr:PIN domain-containing protein [Anaerolineae bacterium]
MIVVVDTNVLVSGLLSAHGAPARVLDLLTTGDLQAAYDDRIVAEYRQVLARPRFGFHPEAVAHLLDYLFIEGLPLVARPLPALLPDLADQPFWEVAVEAAAPLITGNLKHFPAEVCPGIEVLAPATFIEMWSSSHR